MIRVQSSRKVRCRKIVKEMVHRKIIATSVSRYRYIVHSTRICHQGYGSSNLTRLGMESTTLVPEYNIDHWNRVRSFLPCIPAADCTWSCASCWSRWLMVSRWASGHSLAMRWTRIGRGIRKCRAILSQCKIEESRRKCRREVSWRREPENWNTCWRRG